MQFWEAVVGACRAEADLKDVPHPRSADRNHHRRRRRLLLLLQKIQVRRGLARVKFAQARIAERGIG